VWEADAVADDRMIRDDEDLCIRVNGQVLAVTWHAPSTPPAGTPHGAAGVCITGHGMVIVISNDGQHWDLPAGRPEAGESWEQTLRREVLEEACATVIHAQLLGFARGVCIEGHEQGLVLVRSLWRADVALAPWEPRFEIAYRRLVPLASVCNLPIGGAYAPVIRRAFREAGVL
jgi:hypothetical protein